MATFYGCILFPRGFVSMVQNQVVVRLIIAASLCLFIGTLQGVIQVTPGIRWWIHVTGEAGHMVDPLAHAHINLVGGVVMSIMAFSYYALPRLLQRSLYSPFLTAASFYTIILGVFGWYSVLVYFGIREGNMMLHQGISYDVAKGMFQPYHTLGIIVSATVMAMGHWAFIANIILTVVKKPAAVRSPLPVVEEEARV
jgi:cytochrome c oxidase cbb3-type subunit 1